MKISNFATASILAISLLTVTLSSHAGQIFRFQDQDGITTMSKILPPYAAQNGYDILNDKTFRLIEHVEPALTAEQIVEEEKRLVAEKEAQQQAKLAEKQLQEQQRQQRINDNNLRASYQSEQDVLRAKDTELTYLDSQSQKAHDRVAKNKDKLHQLQQQAADTELSGKAISTNFKKRLDAAQNEIVNDEAAIEQLTTEKKQRTEQYDADLKRLKELLATGKH